MQKLVFVLVVASVISTGCKKSNISAPSQSADPLENHLHRLAGNGSVNCGRIAPGADVKSASDCAMQSNQARRPFYVAYDMPGSESGQITVALAGNAEGKLYTVEFNSQGWTQDNSGAELSADKHMATLPCPVPLRLAQSGRVTCYPPPAMGAAGGNPHGGGMMMPPHGMMPMPPPGTPNPHAQHPPAKSE
jgi:hypothetical protein